jgi:arginine decarboxylase-like protein
LAAAENGPALDLHSLTQTLVERGARAPLLYRFLPIVGHRIDKLNVSALENCGQLYLCWVEVTAGDLGTV